MFTFLPLKFWGVWILHFQIMKLQNIKSKYFKTLGNKIQIPLKFREKNSNSKTSGRKIQTLKNFKCVIFNLPFI